MAESGNKEDPMRWSPSATVDDKLSESESKGKKIIDDSIREVDGGEPQKEGKTTLKDPISSDSSSVPAAVEERCVSESNSSNDEYSIREDNIGVNLIKGLPYTRSFPNERGSLSSITTELIKQQFLFEKTLLYPDSKVLNIPGHVPFSYFPDIKQADHIFGGSDIVNIRDFQDHEDSSNGWRMMYFYCDIHESFALSGDWNNVASSYRMEAGDVLYFYRRNRASNNFYIVPLTKKNGYGLVCLFTKELNSSDVSMDSLLLPNKEGDKFFSCVKINGNGSADMKEEDMIHVSDTNKQNWLMSISFIDSYLISGSWSDFVSAHGLKATDVIWFYKVVENNGNERHYFIDYVRAKDAADCTDGCYSLTRKPSRPSDFGGAQGCSSSQKHG